MRLPAVTIAAAFACGIVLGLHPAAVRHASSASLLRTFLVLTALSVVAGIVLVKLDRQLFAAAASLLSWVSLGFVGALLGEQPREPLHVSSLIEHGRIDLKAPLRWHGHLRDEPARLPWGYGYEIELSGVEFAGTLRAARGGLRLGFTPHVEGELPPPLHAGDEVSVLTEARQPQVFKDEGAFDRRAYLAQQGIDLVATLRAPELIERLAVAAPTAATRLAHARRRLRDEIDNLFGPASQSAGVLRAMLVGDRSFVDHADAADFQKTGVFHVLVVAGLHVGALAFALYWMGAQAPAFPRVDGTFHTSGVIGICGDCGAAASGAACGNDGGNRSAWRVFLPAAGFAEFGCGGGASAAGGKTAGFAGFESSTDIRGHRLHCGTGGAMAGEKGSALRARASRLEGRDARRGSRTARGAVSHRSSFADAVDF
jgi:hypothetical protein